MSMVGVNAAPMICRPLILLVFPFLQPANYCRTLGEQSLTPMIKDKAFACVRVGARVFLFAGNRRTASRPARVHTAGACDWQPSSIRGLCLSLARARSQKAISHAPPHAYFRPPPPLFYPCTHPSLKGAAGYAACLSAHRSTVFLRGSDPIWLNRVRTAGGGSVNYR